MYDTFTVNGITYQVRKYRNAPVVDLRTEEQKRDDETYGSYEDQVRSEYNSTRL